MASFRKKIILIKIKLQNKKTFEQVYDLYVEKIYRFIFFKVSNIHEAEDLTSEVFLKAWQYIKDEKEIKSINAFLYALARNKVIDHYRKNSKINNVSLEHNAAKKLGNNSNVSDKIDNALGIESINKFLNKLKPEYREALLLRYVDDFSISEIAEILGKKNGNTRVLIHRALEALKEIMGEGESL